MSNSVIWFSGFSCTEVRRADGNASAAAARHSVVVSHPIVRHSSATERKTSAHRRTWYWQWRFSESAINKHISCASHDLFCRYSFFLLLFDSFFLLLSCLWIFRSMQNFCETSVFVFFFISIRKSRLQNKEHSNWINKYKQTETYK